MTPSIADGSNAKEGLRFTNTAPKVFIGGVEAQVTFSGLSPDFVGVNQINVIVPPVPAGVLPLQIETAGIRTTDRVTIIVAAP